MILGCFHKYILMLIQLFYDQIRIVEMDIFEKVSHVIFAVISFALNQFITARF